MQDLTLESNATDATTAATDDIDELLKGAKKKHKNVTFPGEVDVGLFMLFEIFFKNLFQKLF